MDFTQTLWWQKFRESNVFTWDLISRNIFRQSELFFSHRVTCTVCEKTWNTCSWKIFRENVNFTIWFSNKTLISRNICGQMVWVNFLNLHTVSMLTRFMHEKSEFDFTNFFFIFREFIKCSCTYHITKYSRAFEIIFTSKQPSTSTISHWRWLLR